MAQVLYTLVVFQHEAICLQDLLCLSLVCKNIFKAIKAISVHWKFRQTVPHHDFHNFNDDDVVLSHFVMYSPCKMIAVIDASKLPPSTTHITFRYSALRTTDMCNLPSVTHVSTTKNFNGSIDFSHTVKHITFGKNFDKPIKWFPPLLTHLTFGSDFDHTIDHLPHTLTHLTLGLSFKHPIFQLPPLLIHLEFCSGSEYPYQLSSPLPQFLQVLKIGRFCDTEIPSLPASLTHLRFKPESLPIPPLPKSLESLSLMHPFNQPIDFSQTPNLRSLSFDLNFNQPLTALPTSLTYLVFSSNYSQPIHSFPVSLTHLRLGDNYDQPLPAFPSNLIHLHFGTKYNQPLSLLPSSLTHLKLGNFNHPINLPVSLTHLHIGKLFQQPLFLPPKLSHFFILSRYTHSITIPDSLTCLVTFTDGVVLHLPPEHKFSTFFQEARSPKVSYKSWNTISMRQMHDLIKTIWGVFENCDDFSHQR